jgi:membrane protease YdiL (CAAX protease family)
MNKIRPFGFWKSLLVFGGAEIVFATTTYVITPWIASSTNINPLIVSQIINTVLLFAPLFFLTFWFLRREGCSLDFNGISERLSFRKLTLNDLKWVVVGLAAAIIATLCVVGLFEITPFLPSIAEFEGLTPIELKPLVGLELLFLLFFPVAWFFNYVGEEILWRGYLFRRQELVWGRWTWIMSGVFHTIFHLHLGPMLVLFLPLLFAMPFVYNKTRNVGTVILMHFLIGAPSDLLLALGVG